MIVNIIFPVFLWLRFSSNAVPISQFEDIKHPTSVMDENTVEFGINLINPEFLNTKFTYQDDQRSSIYNLFEKLNRKKRFFSWFRSEKKEDPPTTTTTTTTSRTVETERTTKKTKSFWRFWLSKTASKIKDKYSRIKNATKAKVKKYGRKLKRVYYKIRRKFSRSDEKFSLFANKVKKQVESGDERAIHLLYDLGIEVQHADNGIISSTVIEGSDNVTDLLKTNGYLNPVEFGNETKLETINDTISTTIITEYNQTESAHSTLQTEHSSILTTQTTILNLTDGKATTSDTSISSTSATETKSPNTTVSPEFTSAATTQTTTFSNKFVEDDYYDDYTEDALQPSNITTKTDLTTNFDTSPALIYNRTDISFTDFPYNHSEFDYTKTESEEIEKFATIISDGFYEEKDKPTIAYTYITPSDKTTLEVNANLIRVEASTVTTDVSKLDYHATSIEYSVTEPSTVNIKSTTTTIPSLKDTTETLPTTTLRASTNAKSSEHSTATSEAPTTTLRTSTNAKSSESSTVTSESPTTTLRTSTNAKSSESSTITSETPTTTLRTSTNAKSSESSTITSEAPTKTSHTTTLRTSTNLKSSEYTTTTSEAPTFPHIISNHLKPTLEPPPFPDIFSETKVRDRLHDIFLNGDFSHDDFRTTFDFDPALYEYYYDYY